MVPDWLQTGRSAAVTDSQEGDFIIEIHKPLHDYTASSGTTAFLGDGPASEDILFASDDALSVAGRTHNRLYNARNAHFFYSCKEVFLGVCEAVE